MANFRNSEHYPDPTAYHALRSIERAERKKAYKPLVYICSPFSGDVERNTYKAREYSRYAIQRGCIPLAPHLLFPQFMSEETERELAMQMDLILLTKCDELWVCGDKVTKGMAAEIDKAERKHIKIRYFTDSIREVKL